MTHLCQSDQRVSRNSLENFNRNDPNLTANLWRKSHKSWMHLDKLLYFPEDLRLSFYPTTILESFKLKPWNGHFLSSRNPESESTWIYMKASLWPKFLDRKIRGDLKSKHCLAIFRSAPKAGTKTLHKSFVTKLNSIEHRSWIYKFSQRDRITAGRF